jgi:hypothetical protein
MLRPVFLGTVVAVSSFGLLTIPALAQTGQTQPQSQTQTPPQSQPPAPQQPPQAQQPQQPPAPQAPAQPQFQTLPTQSFTAKSVHVDGLIGMLDIQVSSGPQMTYAIAGEAEAIKTVTATVEGDVLVIDQKDPRSSSWFMWFEWNSNWDEKRMIKVSLTVPTGTPIDIDGIVGDANIGDINGPLKIDIAGADARVGAVTSAEIDAAGAGSIQIKSVQGALSLDVAGSGDVEVGSAGSVNVDIAGSGSLKAGAVAGSLSVDIAGSGDVAIESVSGPVDFSSAGSGDVVIKSGRATPLKISIMGSGSFDFGGEAVDPNISVAGSGEIKIKSYTGTLNTSGVGEVHTENGSLRIE